MPRTPRPRSTTLYLPNPGVPAAGSSGSTPAPAPTLEVLLVAQQIAHARGHTFDIDSFLSPEQRDEYLSLLAARDDDLHDDEEQREGTSEPQGEGSNRGDSDTNGNGNSDGPQTDTDSVTPEGEKRERTPSAGPGDDRGPLKRARLAAHASPLAQAYWRQRLDRMSSTPRIKAEDEGTPAPVVAPSPTPSYTSHWARRHEPPPPLTAADRAEIQESAQFWCVSVSVSLLFYLSWSVF
jgi:hypothetical protein